MTHEDGQATNEGSENQSDIKTSEAADVNKRLLEESIRNKKRATELQAQLDQVERSQAEKAGNIQKMLELERKEREKLQAELISNKKATLESNLRFAVSKFSDQIVSVEDVLNQPKYKDILKLAVDEDTLTVNDDVVKQYIETVLNDKPFLKKQVANAGSFNKKPTTVVTTKSVSAMSKEELKDYMRSKYK
jgi:hypothetical protein